MSKRLFMWSVISIVVGLSACTPTDTSDTIQNILNSGTTNRVVGLIPIDRFPELEVLHVPVEVIANQPFTVTVITHDSSSCTISDGAEVELVGLIATITPMDRKKPGPCTLDLALHPRDVQLSFSEPGRATIRIVGQNFDGVPTVTEQLITVTP
jgi:hypothetical protein